MQDLKVCDENTFNEIVLYLMSWVSREIFHRFIRIFTFTRNESEARRYCIYICRKMSVNEYIFDKNSLPRMLLIVILGYFQNKEDFPRIF